MLPQASGADGFGCSTTVGRAVAILCRCGASVPLNGEALRCDACGTVLGRTDGELVSLGHNTGYWGEIPKSEMDRLLADCERIGWEQAVLETAAGLHDNAANPARAAFQDVLPIPDGSSILDIGAGLGNLACQLARCHRVVAVEGVPERARFLSIRKRQDALDRLTVVNADLNTIRFAPRQFDAIVVNGVLEWVGLFRLDVSPAEAQREFLDRLRQWLTPGGFIYIGIENRFGVTQLRGGVDHSGLRYTSLLPRFLARLVCSRSASYRSAFNTGYRTYTYSYYGYRRLFARAGLRIAAMWIAPSGYNLPDVLVPLHPHAIRLHARMHWGSPGPGWKRRLKHRLTPLLCRPGLWRWFGSDYVFLLTPDA